MRAAWLMPLLLMALTVPARAAVLADLPYSIDDAGHLITTVTINGQGPFSFLIDTGCSNTMIYDHVRTRLGLAPHPGTIEVYAINKVSEAMPLPVETVAVGSEAIAHMTLGVLPDTPQSAGAPDGILGVDVLSRYLVVLDRAHMRFRLETPDSDTSAYAGWSRMTLAPHAVKNLALPFWYIQTRINHFGFATLLDLGASVNMLNWQAAEKLGLHRKDFEKQVPAQYAIRDALGTDAPVVRLKNLTINAYGEAWDGQYALVTDSVVFDRFDLDGRPAAIMGPGLLRNNPLVMDFAHGNLFVGGEINDEIARMHSGQNQADIQPS